MKAVKMRPLVATIFIIIPLILISKDVHAQGMCIKSELTTTVLRGQVWGIYRGSKKLLPNTRIELQHYRNGRRHTVATVETDENGSFDFGKIKPSDYLLLARSYGFVDTEADVIVRKPYKAKEQQGGIIIVLGMGVGECGYAEVKE